MILAVNCNGRSTSVATTLTYVTHIEILADSWNCNVSKNIFNDYNVSVATLFPCYNRIIGC
jgi:hypothetical protein